MQNKQKGFLGLSVLIILGLVLIAGGGYVYTQQKQTIDVQINKNVNATTSISVEGKNVMEEKFNGAQKLLNNSVGVTDIVVKNLEPNSATSVACGPFSRILKIGSIGEDVLSLQTFLVAQGFLNASENFKKGEFDEKTRIALDAYQESNFGSAGREKYEYGVFSGITLELINERCNGVQDSIKVAQKRGDDASVMARLGNVRAAAASYEITNGNFKGLCTSAANEIQDIKLLQTITRDIVCNDTETSWAISAYLPSTEERYFCVDSSGDVYYNHSTLKGNQYSCSGN